MDLTINKDITMYNNIKLNIYTFVISDTKQYTAQAYNITDAANTIKRLHNIDFTTVINVIVR